jgi:hypothetical protein
VCLGSLRRRPAQMLEVLQSFGERGLVSCTGDGCLLSGESLGVGVLM